MSLSNYTTKSYTKYRKEYIELWNFASMISYSVPALNKTIKGVEESIPNYSMVKSDIFKHDSTNIQNIKQSIKTYKKQLSSYLWITNFAFFEAYINGLLDEFIKFINDTNNYQKNIKEDIITKMKYNKTIVTNSIRKLQKPFEQGKEQQYQKYTKEYKSKGFYFPKEYYSYYGFKKFLEIINDLRAKDIPEILSGVFLFDFSHEDLKKYIEYKDKRNNIAHGVTVNYSMYDTIGMFDFFNKLAFKIDQHILNNFFIREVD